MKTVMNQNEGGRHVLAAWLPARRIGFFIFSYPLGISGSIIQSILSLARAGAEVDVFIDQCSFSQYPVSLEQENVHLIEVAIDKEQRGQRFHRDSSSACESLTGMGGRFPRYLTYVENVSNLIGDCQYHLFVGVEPFGLVAADLLLPFAKCPIVYYNMELFQRSNCKFREAHLLKDLEIQASRACVLTVIPDENRARVFIAENRVDERSIRYLPVSTAGEPIGEKGDFFRKMFDLRGDKRILIYAGHITDWARCEEIVKGSLMWPDEYALVFQSWQNNMDRDPHVSSLRREAGPGTYFSSEPIPRDAFPYALSSADVGLMFYRAIDENFTEIGSSSNKLAEYLRAGLPVIASDFPSIRDIFDRYNCGVCVPSPLEIGDVLGEVFGHYDEYRKGAHRAYLEHYSFDRNFAPLLQELKEILSMN